VSSIAARTRRVGSSAPSTAGVARGVVVTAIGGNVAIALGGFWLSFTSLSDLAGSAGIPTSQAWVWPLIVDGMIVVATVSVMALSTHGWRATWFPWLLLMAGTVVSVLGNGVHAALYGDPAMSVSIRVAISAVPPLVLLASTHLAAMLIRRARRVPSLVVGPPTGSEILRLSDPPADETPVESATRDDAMRLKGLDWSNRRIAKALGVHPTTIGRWLNADAGSEAPVETGTYEKTPPAD
jgi:hypothetical protein